jgi:hypothetical protein
MLPVDMASVAKAWTSLTDATCVAMGAAECRCNDYTKVTTTETIDATKRCQKSKVCVLPTTKCVCTLGAPGVTATKFKPVYATGTRTGATDSDADQFCKLDTDSKVCAAAGKCRIADGVDFKLEALGQRKWATATNMACTALAGGDANKCVDGVTGQPAAAVVNVDGTSTVRTTTSN